MDKQKKCSHTGFWIGIALILCVLALSVMLNAGMLIAMAAEKTELDADGQGEDEFPTLTETWSYGSGDVKAAHIAFVGVITHEVEQDLLGTSVDPVEDVLTQIRAAGNDPDVRAIIFEVDSPGGEITPADEIYHALVDFKESDTNRAVVVYVRDLAASGGYYMAAAGDWIIAQPTAIIGSIGVIMQTLNWKGLSDKLGITDTTIKSGGNKDLLNPFREVSTQQVALLQTMVDSFYQRFSDIVMESRGIEPEVMKEMADGRIFTPDLAVEKNFIDEIGYWMDAVDCTAEILDVAAVKVIRYEREQSFFDALFKVKLPFGRLGLMKSGVPRFLYLWKP